MRIFLLAFGLVLLAGCATKEDIAALNTTLYNRCVADSHRDGQDPTKKCGTNPAAYKASWGEKYDYFYQRDMAQQQERAAQAAQAAQAQQPQNAANAAQNEPGAQQQAEANRQRACRSAAALSGAAPGTSNYSFEASAYYQCTGQLLPQPTQQAPVTTACMPNGIGGFSCTTQ